MADYEPWGADYYVIRPDLFVTDVTASDGADGGMVSTKSGAVSVEGASAPTLMVLAVAFAYFHV